MKKFKIDLENFDLKEAVIAGLSHPKGSIITNNLICDDGLELQIGEEIGAPKKSYILVWNKKMSECVAIQKISVLDGNVLSIHLTERFVNDLENAESFKYGRVCLALQWEGKYTIAYLKTANLAGRYVGYLQGLAFYYSEGDLLSAKFMEQEEFLEEKNCGFIKDITLYDDRAYIVAESPVLGKQNVQWHFASKTTPSRVINVPSEIIQNESSDMIRFGITLTFSDLILEDDDAYQLTASYDNYELSIFRGDKTLCQMDALSQIKHLDGDTPKDLMFSRDENYCLELQLGEKLYPYMFSIIMAVYNTEQFLGEAIDSVLAQEPGALRKYLVGNICKDYKKRLYQNIYELILVDDGSQDSSGAICDEYAKRYPQISVIHKENEGVSSARNAGIRVASGKYMNFMDSDDKFSDNVLADTFCFFEKHYDEVDIVAFPMKFFDFREGEHVLNGKFAKGPRVIDLWKNYDVSVFATNSSIFKTNSIKNKRFFDEQLSIGEDVKFVYSIFIDGMARLGVIDSCTYWYRKRGNEGISALDASRKNLDFYSAFLSNGLEWIIARARDRYGFIPQYIQFAVAYQIQWRYRGDGDASIAKEMIGNDGFEKYKFQLTQLLKYIDDNIIIQQKNIWIEQKMYMLSCKLGKESDRFYDGNDIIYSQEGKFLFRESRAFLRLDFLKINDNTLYMEGWNRSFEKDVSLFVRINNNFIKTKRLYNHKNVYSLGDVIFYSTTFQFTFSLNESVSEYEVEFFEEIDGQYVLKKELRFHKTMPITKTYTNSYYIKDSWCVTQNTYGIKLENISACFENLTLLDKYEREFIKELDKKCKNTQAIAFRKEMMSIISNYNRVKHKKIWLLSDRINRAGDNGEALFIYLMKKQDPDIDVYFVIDKNCSDYKRLCKVGSILDFGSDEYKIMYALADCIISSQADDCMIDPFYFDNTSELYKDLIANKKFVFLQHGIITDDISDWLNKYNKNITGFITSARPERQSILEYDYYYLEDEVWLTGLPRYDRLYHDEKNYITIMPTWRKYLNKTSANGKFINDIINSFNKSGFYKFYNALLNDEKLIAAAKEYGYVIAFMPHPNILSSIEEFDTNPNVIFWDQKKSYREVFAESRLVITDYSSTAMDFVYLRKPVVYCQFDRETFFANHTYSEGYFNYESDGFGEVTYDLESLINVIIEYMQKGCELKQIYKDRIEKFFAFNDNNNCERVYRKLKEL